MSLVLLDQEGHFATGCGGFTEEYPNAHIFTSIKTARKVAKELVNAGKATEIGIFKNYGFENESCIDSIFLA